MKGKIKCLHFNAVFTFFYFLFLPYVRRRRIPLPVNTVEEMKKRIIVEKPGTLTSFLEKFNEYMHVIA